MRDLVSVVASAAILVATSACQPPKCGELEYSESEGRCICPEGYEEDIENGRCTLPDAGASDSGGDSGADDAGVRDAAVDLCADPDRDDDGERSRECGGDDCDDDDARRYPGAAEVCDAENVDEDCDPTTFGYLDADEDGAIDAACCNVDPEGARRCGTDCDDARAGTNPAVPEACDDLDNDCDGVVDEMVVSVLYRDADGDGFGTAATTRAGCMSSDGWATTSTDCNDDDATVSPGQLERCNAQDDDCDGRFDEGALLTFYEDADGDMYGVASSTRMACTAPPGYAASPGDCDDTRPSVRPMASEVCDGLDTDCVGGLDYPGEDNDGDGHGDRMVCSMAPAADDCVDTNPAIYGGAPELCDRLDNDCSSGGGVVAAEDADGDGHAAPSAACSGGALPKDDCDDTRATVIPGFAECASATQRRVCSPSGAWTTTSCSGASPLCDARTISCVASGAACGDGQTHAGEECDDGNGVDLDSCDRACRRVPDAPRPITPYSNSSERSRRPTFRVSAVPLAVRYEIALSATRAFTTTATTFSMTATSGAPPADLPVGRRFWRVRAISDSGATSAWSAVWQVAIGRAHGDLTGDGVPDWAASEPGNGGRRVVIMPGGTTAVREITGISVRSVVTGDLNCDGYHDLVAVEGNGESWSDLWVYNGGAGGTSFNTGVDGTIAGSVGGAQFVGDLDGDACDDLLVTVGGQLRLYRGGATFDATHDAILPSGGANGDLNGDGLPDVISAMAGGEVLVHTNILADSVPDLTIPAVDGFPSFSGFGAADLDRDGFDDLILLRAGAYPSLQRRLDVLRGGAVIDTIVDWTSNPGTAVGGVRTDQDMNADGYLDFTLGEFIYYGAPSLALGTRASFPRGVGPIGLTGDITGDGAAEIILGEPGWNDGSGPVEGRAVLINGATRAVITQVVGGYYATGSDMGTAVAPN